MFNFIFLLKALNIIFMQIDIEIYEFAHWQYSEKDLFFPLKKCRTWESEYSIAQFILFNS